MNYPYSLPPKHNLSADRPPTENDDITYGFEIGSLWMDRTNNAVYMCETYDEGAAVWILLGDTVVGGTPTEGTCSVFDPY